MAVWNAGILSTGSAIQQRRLCLKKRQEAYEGDGDSVSQQQIVPRKTSKKKYNGYLSKVAKSSLISSLYISESYANKAPCFDDSVDSYEKKLSSTLPN